MSPGVDTERFYPGCGGAEVRERLGIGADVPVVVCTARLVRRKGQDTLVQVWPEVVKQVPRAVLLLVGDGPYRRDVQRLAHRLGISDSVVFAGAVAWEDVPAHTDAGDVFAMPCRTRLFGLEPEAFGIVFLEAQACGLPVVVGDSGGAPETVLEGSTGVVVRDPAAVAAAVTALLGADAVRDRMSSLAREWTDDHRWGVSAHALGQALAESAE